MNKPKSQKFMFFDDWPYEYARGFVRKQGKPIKYKGNPVMRPELPHEFARTSLYGTIYFDKTTGKFKMWYPAFSSGDRVVANLCYAESDDGYNWKKPELDIVPGTNIILDESHMVRGQTIIHDIEEKDPALRYKLLVRPGHTPRIFSYASADGIHWKILDDAAIIADSDSHVGLMRHPETGIYMATMRKIKGDRRVWISTSLDFRKWTDPVLVKELPIEQSMQTQIYGMQISYYGAYILGMVSYYNTFEDDLDGWGKMDGSMDIGFAYSRGGYCWHENFVHDRFIPTGSGEEWDCGMISPSSQPVYLEDEIRFYYAGMPYLHKPPYGEDEQQCVGTASLRPDGFVYLRAGAEPAKILTRIFAISDTGFEINADASSGEILVEVTDGDGNAVPGFEKENCIPITKDGLRIPLRWKNNPNQNVLLRTSLRLRIYAYNASLYSITMINGEAEPKYWKFREINYSDVLSYHEHSE